jgi:uncharacterized protein YbjT (DUF2867 family)
VAIEFGAIVRVLVTGVTGYVGSRLVPRLVASGHTVVGMARDASQVSGFDPGVSIIEADVLRAETLAPALRGVEVAYYLIHSMAAAQEDFHERDRAAARNFAVAAKIAGVKRVIYLGGLSSGSAAASEHLKSRQETGELLREFGPPVTEFRAGIVVGNGSISYEIIRYLTERLPVMICPR